MQKQILTAHDLSIGITHELVSHIGISLGSSDRIGLIGPNGSGKTTLLKTIAKIEEPFSGSVLVQGISYYVPQISLNKDWGNISIQDYAISMGFTPVTLLAFLKEKFSIIYHGDERMSQLSGGQQLLVVLSCGFLKMPDVLLLDEPTNHLDLESKKVLIHLIRDFSGAVICVSHDVWFLNAITKRLWIIENTKIRSFMGSYREYQEELSLNDESRKRRLESVQKEKKKIENARRQEEIRSARSKREGKKQKFDRSMPRIERGGRKIAAENTAGKNKKRLDEAAERVSDQIQSLSVKKKKSVSGTIATTSGGSGLLRIRDAQLFVGSRPLLPHVSIDLQKGDRVAILGKNGSGKSALVKAILNFPGYNLDPKPYKNPNARFEYLDQHYSIIDPEKTVIDNVTDFSGAQIERVRQHLSHFLFSDIHDVMKKAKELSGGMLARLAFVMLTIAPIDLLILDEPTNNLDIETINAIKELLLEYQGGLVVISHDMHFIEGLEIQKTYLIDRVLKITSFDSDL